MKASLKESAADVNAQVVACQDKADAERKAGQEKAEASLKEFMEDIKCHIQASLKDFKDDIKGHMEACLEGLRSCGKRTTICKVAMEACPEKSKAGPEEMEADVITFEESSEQIKPSTNGIHVVIIHLIHLIHLIHPGV
jgi:N-methylhydantoinase B/oxoprolinase/acetone carboxylase alpha subunit